MIRIKKILRGLLPYGIVRICQKKKAYKEKFYDEYLKYVKAGIHCDFATKIPVKTVVSVQGLGYTGASAVVDILREYDNTMVVGAVMSEDGSLAKQNSEAYEVEFLRRGGGLLELEKFVGGANHAQEDAAIKRLILLLESSPFYSIPEARQFCFEFIYRISENYAEGLSHTYINGHLSPLNEQTTNDILQLKDLSVIQYRSICKDFLNSILSIYGACDNDILVMDSLFGDSEYNIKRNMDYIPTLKTIIVYRDPRDVYAFARIRNIEWIPADINNFIEWWKRKIKYLKMGEANDYLVVRFEDVVRNYENTLEKIEGYLDIKSHTKPKTAFDPAVSNRNVGIYANHPEYQNEYAKLAETFENMLYN